jgi:hypothetical protein
MQRECRPRQRAFSIQSYYVNDFMYIIGNINELPGFYKDLGGCWEATSRNGLGRSPAYLRLGRHWGATLSLGGYWEATPRNGFGRSQAYLRLIYK